MSFSEQRSWLVCYDIRDPRRLGRVHRFLKRHALPVQYSVFVTRCSQRVLEDILDGIASRIDPACDDVRAYHLPERCRVWTLGVQQLPQGVLLPAAGLERLLDRLTERDGETSVTGDAATPEEVQGDD